MEMVGRTDCCPRSKQAAKPMHEYSGIFTPLVSPAHELSPLQEPLQMVATAPVTWPFSSTITLPFSSTLVKAEHALSPSQHASSPEKLAWHQLMTCCGVPVKHSSPSGAPDGAPDGSLVDVGGLGQGVGFP
jgi:hypothetical protein